MTAHPTGHPPCPSSAPCAGCALERETMYERDTDVGMPDMPESDARATILPPGLVASWEGAEHGR